LIDPHVFDLLADLCQRSVEPFDVCFRGETEHGAYDTAILAEVKPAILAILTRIGFYVLLGTRCAFRSDRRERTAMPLIRTKKLYRVRFVMREPTELDRLLSEPVATITKLYEAYTRAEAWEAARVELQLSRTEACRRTADGVNVLTVEEV
jgi:hypothetical protein